VRGTDCDSKTYGKSLAQRSLPLHHVHKIVPPMRIYCKVCVLISLNIKRLQTSQTRAPRSKSLVVRQASLYRSGNAPAVDRRQCSPPHQRQQQEGHNNCGSPTPSDHDVGFASSWRLQEGALVATSVGEELGQYRSIRAHLASPCETPRAATPTTKALQQLEGRALLHHLGGCIGDPIWSGPC